MFWGHRKSCSPSESSPKWEIPAIINFPYFHICVYVALLIWCAVHCRSLVSRSVLICHWQNVPSEYVVLVLSSHMQRDTRELRPAPSGKWCHCFFPWAHNVQGYSHQSQHVFITVLLLFMKIYCIRKVFIIFTF